MLRKNFKGRKEDRKKEADKQVSEREKRSPKQQLAILDKRLGKGVGAKKERTRLLEMSEKPVSETETSKTPVVSVVKKLTVEEKAAKKAARKAALITHENQDKTEKGEK